jgi:flagellar hook-length control protein FliK
VADLMSVLGAAQGPATFSTKKTQKDSEAPAVPGPETEGASDASFNPILAHMIAASLGADSKRIPQSPGEVAEDTGTFTVLADQPVSVSAAFVSGELTKMAGAVQGQSAPPLPLSTPSNDQSATYNVSEAPTTVNGIAVKMTAAEGEPAISIAKDLGYSPSSIVMQQPVSDFPATGPQQSVVAPDEGPDIHAASATITTERSTPSAQMNEMLQAMVQSGPGQVAEDPVRSATLNAGGHQDAPLPVDNPAQSVPLEGTISATPVVRQPDPAESGSKEYVDKNRSTVGAAEHEPSMPVTSMAARPAVAATRTMEVIAASSQTDGPAVKPLLSAVRLPDGSAVRDNPVSEASSSAVTSGVVRPAEVFPAAAVLPVADESLSQPPEAEGANNATQTTTPPHVAAELLKLIQDKVGVSRVMAGRPAQKGAPSIQKSAEKEDAGTELDVTVEIPGVGSSDAPLEKEVIRQTTLLSKGNVAESNSRQGKEDATPPAAAKGASTANNRVAIAANSNQPVIADLHGEPATSAASPGTFAMVNALTGKRQVQAEPGESEKKEEQWGVSGKSDAKPQTVINTASEAKGESASPIKIHTVLQRNQTASLPSRVDQHETAGVHVQQATLPPDLLVGVPDQVAREISLKLMDKVSEMKLVLKPESLGEVSINVRMEEGSMVARIDVTQNQVRSALEANLPHLRDALTNKGIQVDRIDILTSSNSSSRESQSQARDRSRGSLKRRGEVEGVEAYESTRYLGYNTVEYLI